MHRSIGLVRCNSHQAEAFTQTEGADPLLMRIETVLSGMLWEEEREERGFSPVQAFRRATAPGQDCREAVGRKRPLERSDACQIDTAIRLRALSPSSLFRLHLDLISSGSAP